MKAASIFLTFFCIIAAVLIGCNKDDNPAGTTGGPTYYGTFANSAETGAMTLNFASAPKLIASQEAATIINITGTIKVQGGTTIAITGTFNTDNDSLKFSGGGYSFAGILANGEITGSYTGPNGAGGFTASVGAEGSVKVYCGTYHETSPDTSVHGRFNLVIKGTVITGITDSGLELQGTVTSTTHISIQFKELPGVEIATGTIQSDGSIEGTYSVTTESGTQSGTWQAHNCQ
ncbi:MAG TPA: hypothetical protein VL633_09255 [Bacteroidota bacterium]|nr:hypothetical protein [Bacteroidota bacterium]